ncbi:MULTISPECIES: HNH endonuclease [Bacillus]|uniref:HNH endonuclease n=1 Tax=Bacillus TaxID=1386 RepID=UPI001115A349|nr:HNH endonuclease [Bacillus pseudomycoides]MED1594375.1 HNH endonuclease [Bacillus pseudomycoides]MED4714061.1 HNH endonuclease [Bacillus pseudomycoides]
MLIARDTDQFKSCTNALKKEIEDGKISKDLFTVKQLRLIDQEAARIPDLIWHHHQGAGKLQLVVQDVHESARHLGGKKLWGGKR